MATDMIGIGDLVVLNSGGPQMSVVGVTSNDGEQMAVVKWFDDNHRQVGAEILPLACLIKVEDE